MLIVEDIVKTFGGIRAVNHCSFEIEEGTITGLIGPNGAGKSTLFNIISGFETPDSGRVLRDGQDLSGLAPHRILDYGIVRTFQIPHEFDRMTVLENLMLVPPGQTGELVFTSLFRWGQVRRQDASIRRRAENVLHYLGLSELRDEYAGNLSGGQKKLLELGKAMMSDAQMVLLDEPGAGVNRTLLRKLAADIRRLNRDFGYTFCIIEHDLDLIAELCHPVVVMAQGSVLAQGSMEEIKANAQVQEAYLGGTLET
jgi:branched-chain amino acid transport system ATP-binding protein